MSHVVVFVLDTTTGRPAEGLGVQVQQRAGDASWETLLEGVTDATGEIPEFLAEGVALEHGDYRLVYATQAYFQARSVPHFYSEVTVRFTVAEENRYVLPLILGPFGYSTYRGS